jgi:hypothetical protein
MKKVNYAVMGLIFSHLAFAEAPVTKKDLALSCLKGYLENMEIDNDKEEIKLVALQFPQSVYEVNEFNKNGVATFAFAREDKRNRAFVQEIDGTVDYVFERRDTADRPQKCIPLNYPYVFVIKNIKMGADN